MRRTVIVAVFVAAWMIGPVVHVQDGPVPPPRAVGDCDRQPLTRPTSPAPHGAHHEGDAVADEHTFTLVFEASGEVTPAPHPDTAEPDTDAAEPEPEEEAQ